MFTSPHLVDFRERIQVQGDMISKADTMRLGNRLLSMDFGVYPTMFDYCLAMALLYFKEQKCDVVILETGLGGRLDADLFKIFIRSKPAVDRLKISCIISMIVRFKDRI